MLGAACSAFCGAAGANTREMVGAFVGAAVGHIVRLRLIAAHAHVVTLVTLCAFASSVVAFGATWGGARLEGIAGVSAFDVATGKAVLASVLYLVPGVPLVTSVLDIVHFDLTAGLARAAFATVVIVSMAVGMVIFLSIVRHLCP